MAGRTCESIGAQLELAAAAAMPGVTVADVAWLTDYDSYYYDRGDELPLPVVRARYNDAVVTWLVRGPEPGPPVRREERSSRVNRWLYHGLHSLDFPFLYYRRPLWDIVMIACCWAAWGRPRRPSCRPRAASGGTSIVCCYSWVK